MKVSIFPELEVSRTKMSEISLNTVENVDEVEQKSLLITCAAKLHRYHWVTLHFLYFLRKDFPKIPPTPFY